MLYRFFLATGILMAFPSQHFSQVGINTTEPRTALEIGGDVNIDGNLRVNEINGIIDGQEATFLIQNETDYFKEINAAGDGMAIAYFQEYRISNMDGDWVDALNINIPANKYAVIIISAYFDQGLQMSGGGVENNFSIPFASSYVSGGTWFIKADYPSAHPSTPGEWVVNTLIITKSFSKELPMHVFFIWIAG